MCSLSLFPPPLPAGHVTLYESNNELVSATSLHNYQRQDWDPPSLLIPKETLKPHSRLESSSKAAFIHHQETLWMRSANAWCMKVGACCSLAILRWVSSLHGSLFPHLTLSSEDMVAEFSQAADWAGCSVRALAWHPHTDKFAVALLDDSVRVHNAKSSTAPTLKHRLQRNVSALAWKPLCASALAVACQNCVLVWHVDPSSLSTRPSSGCAQVLSQPGHSPVTSLAWSPSGAILLSASPVDTAMMVWDVAGESCVPLQRVGGGGVTFLSWAPDGSRVLAATPSALFRFVLKRSQGWGLGDQHVDVREVAHTDGTLPGELLGQAGDSKSSVIVADLSETTFETSSGETSVGGEIQTLVWDPRGERLAVLLKGNPEKSDSRSIIAVFKTRTSPIFELLPCGFVQGEEGADPHLIHFHPHFQKGALLTVCWCNGRISHIPFYFVSAGVPRPSLGYSPPVPYPSRGSEVSERLLFSELGS
ncbi:UNVERIFIED_CONTAM: hypothetical protein FKN15_002569 [Acipenser sinensis]